MYFGLVFVFVLLVWVFVVEFWKFILLLLVMIVDDVVLGVLVLIDLSFVVNLLMIVIFFGYENFVSWMNFEMQEDRLEWQGEVDFLGLKLKLVVLIVVILGIYLLKVFMDVVYYMFEYICWMVVIYLVFVIFGVLLVVMDWIVSYVKILKKLKFIVN